MEQEGQEEQNKHKRAVECVKQMIKSLAEIVEGVIDRKADEQEVSLFHQAAAELKKYLTETPLERTPSGSDLGIGTYSVKKHLQTDSPTQKQ